MQAQAISSKRTGLALSGGGFRASFFHIGVLAQLARYGMLRHVGMISTVSGGSIIGALYYLELQRLLERTGNNPLEDAEHPERADEELCRLVERVEKQFLAAVEKNLRVRAFLNPLKIIRMALPYYSRSDRIAEMYNEYFYKEYRRKDDEKAPGWPTMPDCMVKVPGAADFNPTRDNDTRVTKVPILLLNATSLNTGHNWRFEAHKMGEYVRDDKRSKLIDKNSWLSRQSYGELEQRLRDFPLPHAVAASTAVPGLFPPLSISEMYERFRVKLSDGGVHDNQGLQGLIDRHCDRYIVSDASGQMKDDKTPTSFEVNVLVRSASVMSDRVREEQLHSMMSEGAPHHLFLHLRHGVIPQVVYPYTKDGSLPKGGSTQNRVATGIPDRVTEHQDLLAFIRTDLDSFTEVEACSLMWNGYAMVEYELRNNFDKFADITNVAAPVDNPPLELNLRFLELARKFEGSRMGSDLDKQYPRHLRASRHLLFKAFRIAPSKAWPALMGVLAVAFAILWGVHAAAVALDADHPWPMFWRLMALPYVASLVACVGVLFRARFFRRSHEPEWNLNWMTVGKMLVRSVMAVAVPPVAFVHLLVFDRIYRAAGRLDKLP